YRVAEALELPICRLRFLGADREARVQPRDLRDLAAHGEIAEREYHPEHDGERKAGGDRKIARPLAVAKLRREPPLLLLRHARGQGVDDALFRRRIYRREEIARRRGAARLPDRHEAAE